MKINIAWLWVLVFILVMGIGTVVVNILKFVASARPESSDGITVTAPKVLPEEPNAGKMDYVGNPAPTIEQALLMIGLPVPTKAHFATPHIAQFYPYVFLVHDGVIDGVYLFCDTNSKEYQDWMKQFGWSFSSAGKVSFRDWERLMGGVHLQDIYVASLNGYSVFYDGAFTALVNHQITATEYYKKSVVPDINLEMMFNSEVFFFLSKTDYMLWSYLAPMRTLE